MYYILLDGVQEVMNISYKLNDVNPDYPPGVSGEYQELTQHMTLV
jgi:hypothetical protein